jgi:soluble lytic murein transglycosylase-like protein
MIVIISSFILIMNAYSEELETSDTYTQMIQADMQMREVLAKEHELQNVSDSIEYMKPKLHTEETRKRIARVVIEKSKEYKLDPFFIMAVIWCESEFKINSRSSVGAKGLMQLMPTHLKRIKGDPLNIENNISYGVKLYAQYKTLFKTYELTLAAYNAGPTLIKRIRRVPNIPETQAHIRKVLYRYKLLKEKFS